MRAAKAKKHRRSIPAKVHRAKAKTHRLARMACLLVAMACVFAVGRWPHKLQQWERQVVGAVRKVLVARQAQAVEPAPGPKVGTAQTFSGPDGGAPAAAAVDALDASIVGQIDAESLAPSLATIQQAPEGSAVHLYISSPGGDAFAMMDWIDAVEIAKAKHHVRLQCDTGALVASAASIIYEGVCNERRASARTIFLFHGVAAMAAGKAGDIEDRLKLLRALEHATAVLVAPHLHMTIEAYEAWIDRHDRFLTTDELAKMGGVDSVA